MKALRQLHSFLISLLLCLPLVLPGQESFRPDDKQIKKIELVYDENRPFQFRDFFPLSLRVHYFNKKGKSRIKHFRHSQRVHKHFSIESENSYYKDGRIYYDYNKVQEMGGNLRLRIRGKRDLTFSETYEIELPILESLKLSRMHGRTGPGHSIRLSVRASFSDGATYIFPNPNKIIPNKQPSFLDEIVFNIADLPAYPNHRQARIVRKNNGLFLVPGMDSPSLLKLSCNYRFNPEIKGKLEIPIRYDAFYFFNFSGADGGLGFMDGSDAEPVEVYVKLVEKENRQLLWVKSVSSQKTREALIDPLLASVRVSCRGGNGEDGMNGCDGSDGGNDPPEDGADGEDGDDGGNGGNGAYVRLFTDQESLPYLNAVAIDNDGGNAGSGGYGGDGGEGGFGKCDGDDGSDGSDGMSGSNGPPINRSILSSKDLEARMASKIR